jgi:hypothetical protein
MFQLSCRVDCEDFRDWNTHSPVGKSILRNKTKLKTLDDFNNQLTLGLFPYPAKKGFFSLNTD